MKFVTVILPLLAALVQSAPVEYSKRLLTSTIIAEELAKIKTVIDDLRDFFAIANIDPTEFYCAHRWNDDIIDRIIATSGWLKKSIISGSS